MFFARIRVLHARARVLLRGLRAHANLLLVCEHAKFHRAFGRGLEDALLLDLPERVVRLLDYLMVQYGACCVALALHAASTAWVLWISIHHVLIERLLHVHVMCFPVRGT